MQGKAIILSAPSGAGKTTIVKHLIKRFSTLEFSISATTRKARSYEKNGVDYYFISAVDFRNKVDADEILEWEEVYEGTYYGTLKSEVERIWKKGNAVIFDVDVEGGVNLKKKLGDKALSIFVKVKDLDVLKNRLKSRNTESEKTLNERVKKAALEMQKENQFDRVILNDDLGMSFEKAEQMVNQFLSE